MESPDPHVTEPTPEAKQAMEWADQRRLAFTPWFDVHPCEYCAKQGHASRQACRDQRHVREVCGVVYLYESDATEYVYVGSTTRFDPAQGFRETRWDEHARGTTAAVLVIQHPHRIRILHRYYGILPLNQMNALMAREEQRIIVVRGGKCLNRHMAAWCPEGEKAKHGHETWWAKAETKIRDIQQRGRFLDPTQVQDAVKRRIKAEKQAQRKRLFPRKVKQEQQRYKAKVNRLGMTVKAWKKHKRERDEAAEATAVATISVNENDDHPAADRVEHKARKTGTDQESRTRKKRKIAQRTAQGIENEKKRLQQVAEKRKQERAAAREQKGGGSIQQANPGTLESDET